MAEVFQTVGFALDAVRELLAAAQRVADARSVLRKIANRASFIEASLENVQDILILMRDKLQPLMPQDQYDRLQKTLIMCVNSCRTELEEAFDLVDRQGRRVTTPTIMRRLKVAARNQKIHEDRATLDSIMSDLNTSIGQVNVALNLIQVNTNETTGTVGEANGSLRRALDQVNEKTQRQHEQVERWKIDIESDSITRVDSVDPMDDNDSLLLEIQYELEPAAKDNEWTIVHQALRSTEADTIELLLQSTPNLKDAVDSKGQTPLHHCANGAGIVDAFEKAQVLLRYGANVNSQDDSEAKRTPLYLAMGGTRTPERDKMVELLVNSGATVNTRKLSSSWMEHPCLKQYKTPRAR